MLFFRSLDFWYNDEANMINGTGSFKRILNKPKFSQQRGFFVEPFDLILSTKEETNAQVLESKEKDKTDGFEWVILNTPFGKKRIKRKK